MAEPLASSGRPIPGIDGVWVQRYEPGGNCLLKEVGFDGDTLRAESAIDCDVKLTEETPLGLVGWTEVLGRFVNGVVLDPDDLSRTLELGMVHAVTKSHILYRAGRGFTLVDPQTDTEIGIDSPTEIGSPDHGAVSPDRRHVAIAFKHPAWPGPTQRLDVWVLDTVTLDWTQLPSMPVAAALKQTSVVWAPDGRLVMFGAFDEVGAAIATWRPGDEQLQVRQVDFAPAASMVIWCSFTECE